MLSAKRAASFIQTLKSANKTWRSKFDAQICQQNLSKNLFAVPLYQYEYTVMSRV